MCEHTLSENRFARLSTSFSSVKVNELTVMSEKFQGEKNASTYSFPCLELVRSVEFSPFSQSSELIAYGGDKRVSVSACHFPEEDPEITDFHFEHVVDFYNGTSVQGIAWSPNSSIRQFPQSVQ